MKPSKYNFFFPYEADDSKMIAYNSFSNALALMDKDKYEAFDVFCNSQTFIDDKELTKQLKRGGFLVEDDYDELRLIRLQMLKSRFNTDTLTLVIAPTADCNFRCPYCYEKDVIRPDYMSGETEDKVIEFARKRMKGISKLSVAWYGGEPLMHFPAVERIAREFISLCKENHVDYYSIMITNGYALTKELCEVFRDIKISRIQITIDGTEHDHNQRRPLVDGSGSYGKIIENLIECKDVLPLVDLRINIDRGNAESSKDVIRILRENDLTSKVRPYLGMITANESYNKSTCLTDCDFSQFSHDFAMEASQERSDMSFLPRKKTNFCMADSVGGYVIGSDGRLYSCLKDIGKHNKCKGNLAGDVEINHKTYLDYILHDPTQDKKCKDCNLLPVCMGECPSNRVDNGESGCSLYKHTLNRSLEIVTTRLKSKNKNT